METETEGRVVYTADVYWWQLAIRGDQVVVGDTWEGNWEAAAAVASINLDDDESWVCRVAEVHLRHPAIRPGDYACCDGHGCDVVFVRLDTEARGQRTLCGLAVSQAVYAAAMKDWPKRPPTGYDTRSWQAACRNHVLLVAREHGEEPDNAQGEDSP